MKVFSASEIVKEFNISRPTLIKKLNSGEIKGVKTLEGWQVNLEAILGASLSPRNNGIYQKVNTNSTVSTENRDPTEPDNSELIELRSKIVFLSQELAHTKVLADERIKTIDDLRLSLRALTAAQPVQIVSENTPKRKKGWWKRA